MLICSFSEGSPSVNLAKKLSNYGHYLPPTGEKFLPRTFELSSSLILELVLDGVRERSTARSVRVCVLFEFFFLAPQFTVSSSWLNKSGFSFLWFKKVLTELCACVNCVLHWINYELSSLSNELLGPFELCVFRCPNGVLSIQFKTIQNQPKSRRKKVIFSFLPQKYETSRGLTHLKMF